jgi:squalene-associated FAD-dependent desaturase
MTIPKDAKVAVIGGGLAGLSAACALADAGMRVTLCERRPYLGGRASSYEHPGTNETVDNCQHVLLGCCTNLIDLYRRLGVEDKIRWYDRLNFIEPGGRMSVLGPSFLPAPFHSTPSFMRAKFLSIGDKDAIARGLLALMPGLPVETGENFLSWLERHGQTPRAILRFWEPVLVSALNESLDRMSVHYAAQVFRESFLKSAAAGRMGVPSVPLSELYGVAADYIQKRGGEVLLRASVYSLRPTGSGGEISTAGKFSSFDGIVSAVPFDVLAKMLPPEGAGELHEKLKRFETSPITGIHFWFDRVVTDLPHAVLLDRTIQWMFNKSRLQEPGGKKQEKGSYLELVVSSSKTLVDKSKQEILDLALAELKEFFPAINGARVLKSTVIKEIKATYSALPMSDAYRPPAATQWPRLFLAGDWTLTGWPATMEGAVRSGYKAADALLGSHANLKPDLPASGLMRIFG